MGLSICHGRAPPEYVQFNTPSPPDMPFAMPHQSTNWHVFAESLCFQEGNSWQKRRNHKQSQLRR